MMNVIIEGLIIGLILGIIGTPLSYIAMRIERKYVNLPAMSWFRIFLTFVISGLLVHLLLEGLGWNKKYCEGKNRVKI